MLWNWVPVIESGDDSVKEWGFTSNADRFFMRLRYTDIPTTDPENDDFDGDGVPNIFEIMNGFNPFGTTDANNNGMPDEWELFNAGKFAIWPPSLSASIPRNQTANGTIYLRNDTANPVNYSVAITDNLGPSYGFEDSVTGNISYTWEEISTTGTKLENISNVLDGTQPVDLVSFTFPFFGSSFNRVHVSNNGLMTFGTASSAFSNLSIPSPSAPANLIAPFWDDLDTRTIGDIYYKEESDRLILQYENVGRYGGGTTSAYTFQVVLFADGRIQFRYKSMAGTLNSATIGIQDSTRTIGLQVAHNAAYVANEMAVEINPQSSFLSVSPASGTVPANTTLTLDALFRSLQLPFGTYTATVTTSHDAPEVAGPHTATATLEVFNSPATVALTAPAPGTEILQGDNLTITATATDPEGMQKVEFYNGLTKLGERISTPFSYTWNNPPVGTHTLTARAIDIFGGSTTSAPVTVTVLADSDGDRMPDVWEIANFGNLDQDASGDFDGDGFPNILEYHHGTDPADPEDHPEFSTTQTGTFKYYIVDSGIPTNTTFEKKTIVAAISAANNFDIIEVRPGNYPETFTLNKRLYLFSTEGARNTILDGTGKTTSIVSITAESVLSGFTIRNLDRRTVTSANGGGIVVNVTGTQNRPRIIACVIAQNSVGNRGGGVYIQNGSPTFISCTIADNYAPQGAGIYNLPSNNSVPLHNTLLWNTPGDGLDLAGQTAGFINNRVLRRDPTTGQVHIDGTSAGTANSGLGFGWSLTATSPARDAGNLTLVSPTDMDGEMRPAGAAPDIGADEFHDSDADGLPDWLEALGLTDPNADHDGDGLSNLAEYETHRTDPRLTDTDGDGLSDGDEVTEGTDPTRADSDFDGMPDSWEVLHGLNPFDPADATADPDNDGYTNLEEFQLGKNPNLAEDTDGDGIPDGIERNLIYRFDTYPYWDYFNINNPDTDTNGIPDGLENYDKDGLTVLQELALGTDPNLADTDADGVNDGMEVALGTNPLVADPWATRDSDDDGLADLFEINFGTDPFNRDTNGNGMPDGQELDNGGDPINPGPPPTQLPPPSTNPEPPADPAPQPPDPINPGEYDILVETKSVGFPKYGHATFQVLDPPKRFLQMSSQQSFSGGCPESGPLGVSGSKTVSIDAETGESTTTGDGFVSSSGTAQSPVRRGGSSSISSYDDPPNQESDCSGTITYSSTLSRENTTEMMVTNGKSKLEAFEDNLQPGTPFAYRNVHENELQFDYQKVQFKFKWKEGVSVEQRRPLAYLLLFQPEDDPETPEDESTENVEVIETITWNGQAGESEAFIVDPDQRKNGVDGSYHLVEVLVSYTDLFMTVGPLGNNPPCEETESGISLTGQAEIRGFISVTPEIAVKNNLVNIRLVQTVTTYREATYKDPVPGRTKQVLNTNGQHVLDSIQDGSQSTSVVETDGGNVRIIFQDQPRHGYLTGKNLFNSLSMNDEFRVYLQVKLQTQPESDWRTVGLVNWSVVCSCTGNPSAWTGGTTLPSLSTGAQSSDVPPLTPSIGDYNLTDQ